LNLADTGIQVNDVDPLVKLTEDRVSNNGRLAFSDPETRILQTLIEDARPSILIEVTTGTEGVLAPFDSPSMLQVPIMDSVQQAIDLSIHRANHLATNYCPVEKCISGAAAKARMATMGYRSGTIGDHAVVNGVGLVLTLQVVERNQQTQLDEILDMHLDAVSVMRDCLGPYMPMRTDHVILLARKWVDLLAKATKKS